MMTINQSTTGNLAGDSVDIVDSVDRLSTIKEMSKDFVVARLEPALKLMRQATDAPSAKKVVDMAHAAEVYAKRQKMGEEAIGQAHRIKVDAMTLLGDFLREQPKNTGTAGIGRPKIGGAKKEPPKIAPKLEEVGISKKESSLAQKLSVLAEKEPEKHLALRNGVGALSAALTPAHVGANSGDNEWYTPVEIIEAAREVMGGIDLDPASSEEANEVVKARKFYAEKQNGLSLPWDGRVWMNPPYAGQLIKAFVDMLFHTYTKERVSEAIVLVNNATETSWFQQLAESSTAICFPRGRVKFWHPRKEAAPLQGQAIVYLGKNQDKFGKVFRGFGFVCLLMK